MDAVVVQECEWIKIGVDTGAGKTAWSQSAIFGKRIAGDVDLRFRTAAGEFVKSGKRLYVDGCDDGEVTISEFDGSKRLCANHCCLMEIRRRWVELQSRLVTKVTCSTRTRMLRRKLKHEIQKETSSSRYRGYNIYMKPKGNETDAMPLSQSSGELLAGSKPARLDSSDSPVNSEDPGGADGANPGGRSTR